CIRAYPSVKEIPDAIDVAHIVIPANLVPQAVRECGEKGVKVVIINSAGFKEVGAEGAALEDEVVKIAKEYRVRVLGPNCQGIINSDASVRAYCNFTFTYPKEGNISIVAQSGGVGEVLNQRLDELGIGVRMYASNGNACDISIPEIISFWGDDEKTRVIIVHIENLSDPKGFLERVSKVTRKKPVLAMKTGRTVEGSKAVASHTGGLAGGEDRVTEALLDKCGCVVFRDEEELCQAAIAFSKQPIPRGGRVGMLTNTGGPAIIATDELIEAGLTMPALSEESQKRLRQTLYPAAVVSNPVDVLATGTPEHWEVAVDTLIKDENIDSVLINFVTPFFVDTVSCAKKFAAKAPEAFDSLKPLIMCVMTDRRKWTETLRIINSANIPEYEFPETAAKALIAMTRYSEILSRPLETPRRFEDVKKEKVERILSLALKEKRTLLTQAEGFEVLSAYGIRTAKWASVGGKKDLDAASDAVGFPAVLKVDDPKEALHKSEKGALILDIKDKSSLKRAADRLWTQFSPNTPLLLQEMIDAEREVIIGALWSPGDVHLIMFGAGGVAAELLRDVSFCVAPVTPFEAKRMISRIKLAPLLSGFRKYAPADTSSLAEMVERLSILVSHFPQIKELDVNPVKVPAEPKTPVAVDVRIII
ncbi:MAG: acetate--CoA ligase family protein, partial [Planctomycetota bacterium]|nr:acetate--CoA ligase family protein [Planctomycetota bacterium]